MKKQNWDFWIEIPGYLFVITLFLSIWISEYRWRLFFSSFFFIFISIVNVIVKKDRKRKK